MAAERACAGGAPGNALLRAAGFFAFETNATFNAVVQGPPGLVDYSSFMQLA